MGTIKSEVTLYNILHRLLEQARDTQTPVTSVEIFDDNDIRKFAADVNKISDTLGHMWRSGYIDRFPAPKKPNSQAKYAYALKRDKTKAQVRRAAAQDRLDARSEAGDAGGTSPRADPPRDSAPVPFAEAVQSIANEGSRTLLDRPHILITNDGTTVTITLPSLIVEIRGR